jgi:hypothetical protein
MTPALKNALTAEQINRYWDAYFAVIDVLIATLGKLEQLEKDATDLGERSGYRADRLRVEADIEMMRAKRLAFNANRSPIAPPSTAVVNKMIELAKDAADIAADRAEASAVVTIAGKAVNEFNKIQAV